ncbi:MAG: ABC transporter ATP-binding protein [Gemmatimonadaceae bacterium]|nr:ABC transporter ATP-binding protein [Gemmatimonadaceae bacterium]
MTPPAKDPKKPKFDSKRAWAEARALIWTYRKSVGIGLGLMLVAEQPGPRAPGEAPSASSTRCSPSDENSAAACRHRDRLGLGAATVIQAVTSYALSQVVSVAAQQAIAKLREEVQAHLMRLPVRFFDSTKSGVLISRVMNDPEGIRNLVGTGLIQLVGGLVTATAAVGVLFWLNWQLTLGTVAFLAIFAIGMSIAFKRLRPIFRERGRITAEVTGRLAETMGGIRVVKVYTAEKREREVFSGGVDTAVPQHRGDDHRHLGHRGADHGGDRRDGRAHDDGRRCAR